MNDLMGRRRGRTAHARVKKNYVGRGANKYISQYNDEETGNAPISEKNAENEA